MSTQANTFKRKAPCSKKRPHICWSTFVVSIFNYFETCMSLFCVQIWYFCICQYEKLQDQDLIIWSNRVWEVYYCQHHDQREFGQSIALWNKLLDSKEDNIFPERKEWKIYGRWHCGVWRNKTRYSEQFGGKKSIIQIFHQNQWNWLQLLCICAQVGENKWDWYSSLEFFQESIWRGGSKLCHLVHTLQAFHTSRKFGRRES